MTCRKRDQQTDITARIIMKLQPPKLVSVIVLKEREASLRRQGVARASAFLLVSLQVLNWIVEVYNESIEKLRLSFHML